MVILGKSPPPLCFVQYCSHCQSPNLHVGVIALTRFWFSVRLRHYVPPFHRYPSSPTPVLLDWITLTFWVISNTRFPLCLWHETMIHPVLRYLFFFSFWESITSSENAELSYKHCWSCSIFLCLFVITDTREISHSFKLAHEWLPLTLQTARLLFPFFPIQITCSFGHYLTKIISYWSAVHKQVLSHCELKSVRSLGMLFVHYVCYVTWPLAARNTAYYRYCHVFESFIQGDDTYLNQSPSCFAAMKLSPGKVQTEKVKPRLLTSIKT